MRRLDGQLMIVGLVLLLTSIAEPAAATSYSGVKLGQIGAQLLYETCGTLSKNLLVDPNFVGWNLVARATTVERSHRTFW